MFFPYQLNKTLSFDDLAQPFRATRISKHTSLQDAQAAAMRQQQESSHFTITEQHQYMTVMHHPQGGGGKGATLVIGISQTIPPGASRSPAAPP